VHDRSFWQENNQRGGGEILAGRQAVSRQLFKLDSELAAHQNFPHPDSVIEICKKENNLFRSQLEILNRRCM
jgi:hypothetical protein